MIRKITMDILVNKMDYARKILKEDEYYFFGKGTEKFSFKKLFLSSHYPNMPLHKKILSAALSPFLFPFLVVRSYCF